MEKKKFTRERIPEIFYEVVNEFWLDDNTYVIIFQDMVDVDGGTYHLEVEYHKDEERVTYTRVYGYENVDASKFVAKCFKKQIDEYILQKVGVLREGSYLTEKEVVIWLKLDVPKNTLIGEIIKFLNSLKFDAVHTIAPKDEKIKILGIEAAKRRV